MASAALPPAVAPLRDRAGEAALFLDYDGTLAPIVDDPAAALPAPGARAVLGRLGSRLGTVAVVSGRPVAFLEGMLGRPRGVHLAGLYGMEQIRADGTFELDAAAAPWCPGVEEVAEALRRRAPPGVGVEAKGLSVTVHWRRAPGAEAWVREAVAAAAARTGLRPHEGRRSLELRPPVPTDKGSVVRRLGSGRPVVGCFGDDLGDLPAFEAVAALRAAGATTVTVAVVDAESAPEVVALADLTVDGPEGAVALLEAIAPA